MGRTKEIPPAVRVYTVCDESRYIPKLTLIEFCFFLQSLNLFDGFRYLVVRKVPALGCGDDLMRLFATYGEVEE